MKDTGIPIAVLSRELPIPSASVSEDAVPDDAATVLKERIIPIIVHPSPNTTPPTKSTNPLMRTLTDFFILLFLLA
jgi:hypothetical protein